MWGGAMHWLNGYAREWWCLSERGSHLTCRYTPRARSAWEAGEFSSQIIPDTTSSHICSSPSPHVCWLQALAKERGETSVEGEVHKWLGHCWSKLADSKKAEQYFLEGVEFGKSKVRGGGGWRGARRERRRGAPRICMCRRWGRCAGRGVLQAQVQRGTGRGK